MVQPDTANEQARFEDYIGDLSESELTQSVMDWLGLASSEGAYDCATLARLNDKEDFTFAEIADVIESQPEGLFDVE